MSDLDAVTARMSEPGREPWLVRQADACRILGLNHRSLSAACKRGSIARGEDGRVDLLEVSRWVLQTHCAYATRRSQRRR